MINGDLTKLIGNANQTALVIMEVGSVRTIIGEIKQLIAQRIVGMKFWQEMKFVMMVIHYQIEKDVKLTVMRFYQAGYVKMDLTLT